MVRVKPMVGASVSVKTTERCNFEFRLRFIEKANIGIGVRVMVKVKPRVGGVGVAG